MTHLPYIVAAYALALLLGGWLSIAATLRLSRARRRLEAIEAASGRRARRQTS
ncbi:hypothetical protein [Lichenicoccus sp.]|uniref:hypothetical protein n=1 Tax=Lichenicoccus sp. TaxID=2781899 RepID=UPI003D0A4487